MKLVADCGKISENSRAIVELCRARGVKLACVTKCVCGEPAIARAILAGGVDGLAESRLFNIRRLREAGIDAHIILMRMPLPEEADEVVRLADCSFNSEPAAIRALSAAAQQQGTIHQVVVMVENGDRREGVMFDQVEPLCRLVLDLPGLQLAGLATSLNCLCGVMPSVENQQRFADLASHEATTLCDESCQKPQSGFFARYRQLTAVGYYTTPVGMRDLGYVGNVALASYDGPPPAVMKQIGMEP